MASTAKALKLTMKLVAGPKSLDVAKLGATVDQAILNKKLLQNAVNKANVRNLYKSAGLVRTFAIRSIKKSKKKSNPGQPPHHHTNPGLRLIKFEVDKVYETAIVSTIRFGETRGVNVPINLEQGGPMQLRRGKLRRKVIVRPRPFMAPAEKAARAKYPQFWKDCL
jgi:hypothetical protein